MLKIFTVFVLLSYHFFIGKCTDINTISIDKYSITYLGNNSFTLKGEKKVSFTIYSNQTSQANNSFFLFLFKNGFRVYKMKITEKCSIIFSIDNGNITHNDQNIHLSMGEVMLEDFDDEDYEITFSYSENNPCNGTHCDIGNSDIDYNKAKIKEQNETHITFQGNLNQFMIQPKQYKEKISAYDIIYISIFGGSLIGAIILGTCEILSRKKSQKGDDASDFPIVNDYIY